MGLDSIEKVLEKITAYTDENVKKVEVTDTMFTNGIKPEFIEDEIELFMQNAT